MWSSRFIWNPNRKKQSKREIPPMATRRRNSKIYPIKADNDSIQEKLQRQIIGQTDAIDPICRVVRRYNAGLSPENRPAGVFLLMGGTGVGKTQTVEALASTLHGTKRQLLRVDCGEFQMDHEVARLIGAPPGYLGHRETNPLFTQARLASVTSEDSSLAVVLLDEIEKAAPSLQRMLLGILDKATLRLGDNNVVNFERTIIFMTSNLGARQVKEGQGLGYAGAGRAEESQKMRDAYSMAAARKHFSPEFMNRLDHVLVYHPLERAHIEQILDIEINKLQWLIDNRLGPTGVKLQITAPAKQYIINRGYNPRYGARELKRELEKLVLDALAEGILSGEFTAGCTVCARVNGEKLELFKKEAKIEEVA